MLLRRVMVQRARALVATCIASALFACGVPGREPLQTVAGGNAARGAKAIPKYGCGTCHVIPGVDDASGMVGPPLTAFGRRTLVAGRVPNGPDALVRFIRDPQGMDSGNAMPPLGVTEGDARDIAAYLFTLR